MNAATLSGSTRMVGLIGSPVLRSESPAIHNAVFEELGCDYAYSAFDVAEDQLENAVRGLVALGFVGYNVTAPYKKRVVEYLDEISRVAQISGAVNTVAIQGGRSLGDNADGAAFMRTLVHEGINILGKKITILGCGGAGSAIGVQAALDGVAAIDFFNRDDAYRTGGDSLIGRLSDETSCDLALYDLEDAERLRVSIAESELLVNATNVGTCGEPGCLVDASLLTPDVIVAEMVYTPRETELVRRARARGCRVVDGVGPFLQQAAIAERLWFGIDMPVEAIERRLFS